jgi:hypothetical protein
VCAGWIQNRLIPVEPFSNAAVRPRLRRGSGCQILQFRGDDVLRVPELTRSAISDSSERAAAWRPPVRREIGSHTTSTRTFRSVCRANSC